MEAERYCIDKAPNQLGDLASVTDADTYEFILNMNGRKDGRQTWVGRLDMGEVIQWSDLVSINGKWNNQNAKTKLPFFCQYTLKGEHKIISSLRMTRLDLESIGSSRIIVSASVPVPFLWILDLGLGFGLDN